MGERYGRTKLPVVGQPQPVHERRDAARNRAKILATARELLDERPIGEICMDELARRAGRGQKAPSIAGLPTGRPCVGPSSTKSCAPFRKKSSPGSAFPSMPPGSGALWRF